MSITTDRDKVRLEIGDVDTTAALYTDDELDYFLDVEGDNILQAAARACDAAARKFARAYDFAEDGQSFSRSQMSKQYAQLALELRRRVAAGITNLPTTRVDGYSQDVAFDDVEGTTGTGHARIGWTSPDLPN